MMPYSKFEPCWEKQPGRLANCERDKGHEGEHQATFTPGRTYCYWTDGYPVEYCNGTVHSHYMTEKNYNEAVKNVLDWTS